ncbi:aldehyde dehydrogenase [Rhodococcus sp. WMMA185]|uniref:aldehyde dehydrogenase family protein n=1 Tax=Rhodococcus sp. WMMA185 TaxID=679318 RepID=UPI0008789DE8|nr:aldehyde dehydrogenase family protein [Rhodococcus sp. WMMA185]AOW91877.1 aldehyde dehydrogenase [Rhodococcus sp. WMMA185]
MTTNTPSSAATAIDRLDPLRWAKTSPLQRLRLLETVRENCRAYAEELARADATMKNELMGEELYSISTSKVATVVPIANTLSACIELYEHLAQDEMMEPASITQVADGLFDVQVAPRGHRERLMNPHQRQVLRVRGEPTQISPMDKPAGIIAVLGAGNYSSSLEMVKALFLANCAVVHKPHKLNRHTDKVWAKIFAPLVEHQALSFLESDPDRSLNTDARLSRIYFTGGTSTALRIMESTDTPLVSECGGNNPCIVVPGDRAWTDKEMQHQAIQIATTAKMNGGAVCGRVQTIVTSKHWPQRDQFLAALRKAIVADTPAAGTYYPSSDQVAEDFKNAYPDAEVLEPEDGSYRSGVFLLITGAEEDGYATRHEAFTQIIDEVPLDVAANAAEFLPHAVDFANTKLLGTLGCSVLIDEDTKKAHQAVLDRAVSDLRYGGIAVNTMPPFIFLSPYLTWGGNEGGREFVSGQGNFGNLLCFQDVEKSIMTDHFTSAGHMMNTNKAGFDAFSEDYARYALNPSWINLTRLMGEALVGNLRRRDF